MTISDELRVGAQRPLDVLLRGGLVVDGSGGEAQQADVGIREGRIEVVGRADASSAQEVIDCTGLVVAPGFIDVHTHYDAQVLWDPALTPSSWQGVTTVVTGNCGFSIAPTRPDDRSLMLATLENVEGMSRSALEEGVAWEFETFAEYLDALDRRPLTINVTCLAGHTALRTFELREDADTRPAGPDEVRNLQALLSSALDAGARGFATSRAASHVGPGRLPIASRLADPYELTALAHVVRAAGRGIIQIVGGPGYDVAEFSRLADESQRPVTWTSLRQGADPRRHWDRHAATMTSRQAGHDLWAQVGCMEMVAQETLEHPYGLESVPAFGELSSASFDERVRAYRDAGWRRRAIEQMGKNREGRSYEFAWERVRLAESAANPHLVGCTMADLAKDRGGDPVDVLIDLALDDDLRARFDFVHFNWDEEAVGELLQQDGVVLGLSDAGAHANQMCHASFAPYLLANYVRRRRMLTLEQAVWRLSGQPAALFGLERRGLLREGYHADVCVFDPLTVDEGPPVRVYDLPGGADRIVKEPVGIEHVFVNGEAIRRANTPLADKHPGLVLR